jgi:hypothetical protein
MYLVGEGGTNFLLTFTFRQLCKSASRLANGGVTYKPYNLHNIECNVFIWSMETENTEIDWLIEWVIYSQDR